LIYDGIIVDYKIIEKMLGEIILCETNNDRSVNGSLNNILLYFEEWKYDYGNFDNMPFRELNNRLNHLPNKMLNWQLPQEKMNELMKAYNIDN
jgi:IS30 family transposase